MMTATTIEHHSRRVAFITTGRLRKRAVRSTAPIETTHRTGATSVTALVEAILKQSLDAVGTNPTSTTEAILQDPVWRDRIRASLAQARAGHSRPIEDYWAESD